MIHDVAILGTGLIGASMGLGLRAEGKRIIGWDPSADALRSATEVGAIDATATSSAEATALADLVVLSGPALAVADQLGELDFAGLVIDVAGVKEPMVKAARAAGIRFVGTHPMAGREHPGAEHASARLFKGATWIVTDDHAAEPDLLQVERMIESLGGIPVRMSAARHDAAVAAISHIPQLVALALIEAAADGDDALELAAGGFRDLTRIALSDPTMWADVMVANREQIAVAADDLAERLRRWSTRLDAVEPLRSEIAAARKVRQSLAPPVVAVRLILEDRPGSLAAVGRALAASRADIRDLQLRHGPHGGGGVLTLSVRPGEAETLRHALEFEGFELTD